MFSETQTHSEPPPLLQGLINQNKSFIESLSLELPSPPKKVPRMGVGAAFMLNISEAYGRRNRPQPKKIGALIIEGYNQYAYCSDGEQNYKFWLRQCSLWSQQLRKRGRLKQLQRFMQLLSRLQRSPSFADFSFPESPLFFRLCTATAILTGEIPLKYHEPLDLMAFWFGMGLEEQVNQQNWMDAQSAMNISVDAYKPNIAFDNCLAVISKLPQCEFTKQMYELIPSIRGYSFPPVPFKGWSSYALTIPSPSKKNDISQMDEWSLFSSKWCPHIDQHMDEMIQSSSICMAQAKGRLLSSKGKRLRPLLLLATLESCGVDSHEGLPLSSILEWLHQVSLIIDDIIDQAPMRRKVQTLHTHSSSVFALGVSTHLAIQLYSHLSSFSEEIQDITIETMVHLLIGQSSELDFVAQWDIDPDTYFRIIEGKTASLFSFAAECGAILGKKNKWRKALKEYGRLLGMAFQIVDDILDYTGDSVILGKNPGADLQAQKVSFPILLLRQALNESDKKHIFEIFTKSKTTADDFLWVSSKMSDYGIGEQCLQIAEDHVNKALAKLESLPQGTQLGLLKAIGYKITRRIQ